MDSVTGVILVEFSCFKRNSVPAIANAVKHSLTGFSSVFDIANDLPKLSLDLGGGVGVREVSQL